MKRAWSLALIFLIVSAYGCNSSSNVTCGPGTHEVSGRCVLNPDAGLDARPPGDAAAEADLDARVDTGPPGDAGADAMHCAAQCDCPAGTTCTIQGVCSGFDPCTQSCVTDQNCPCGRACKNGYCDFPIGSLKPCTHTCDCSNGEICANGQCIHTCSTIPQCGSDSQCAACGKVCEPFYGNCTVRGQNCFCNADCAGWGLDGEVCDNTTSDCVTPPGTRLDLPSATLVAGTSGWLTATLSASTSAAGSTQHITLVLDMDVDPTNDLVDATLIAPDGSSHPIYLSWDCTGAPTRWSGKLDTSPLTRSGEWKVKLIDQPLMPGSRHVEKGWLFLG